jgi:membrane fusion protein (multidrug efflux system)
MVSPGMPLFLVADVSSVYVVVNVKQDDLDKVKLGQPAQVIMADDDRHPLTGTVSILSPVANQAARVFEARIKVDNKDGLLKTGMFVKTRITTGEPLDILAVPQEAMSGQEGSYYVFVAEGNQARQRTVEIGTAWAGLIEVKSGLKAGDKVIVTNVNKLKDDDPIAIAGQQGDK